MISNSTYQKVQVVARNVIQQLQEVMWHVVDILLGTVTAELNGELHIIISVQTY